MKNTIKLFMVAAAFFISGNLFAQTVSDYQNRLHNLQLCHDYLEQMLTAQQMTTVDNEMTGIESKLQVLNALPLTPTLLDKYIIDLPSEDAVVAYVKILALYTEPMFLLGHNLTPAEKTTYEDALSSRAAT